MQGSTLAVEIQQQWEQYTAENHDAWRILYERRMRSLRAARNTPKPSGWRSGFIWMSPWAFIPTGSTPGTIPRLSCRAPASVRHPMR